MYLDYAEDMAKQHIPMHMADWEIKLNEFLRFYGRKVLDNAGTITAEKAREKAFEEYEKYNAARIERKKTEFEELENKVSSFIERGSEDEGNERQRRSVVW